MDARLPFLGNPAGTHNPISHDADGSFERSAVDSKPDEVKRRVEGPLLVVLLHLGADASAVSFQSCIPAHGYGRLSFPYGNGMLTRPDVLPALDIL